jgi:hypothetical protein
MNLTRVLICHNYALLDNGIGSLLSLEMGMDVTSSLPKDSAEVLALVTRYQPDVLVFGEYLIDQDRPLLAEIFELSPGLRIIVVSTNHNLLKIYQKRELMMKTASDLIHVIQAA